MFNINIHNIPNRTIKHNIENAFLNISINKAGIGGHIENAEQKIVIQILQKITIRHS